MASAQQKPKATSADKRNPRRRNGKAFAKELTTQPSGNSIMGYKVERVEKWAREAGMTTAVWVAAKKEGRALKRATRRIRTRCGQRCCNPA